MMGPQSVTNLGSAKELMGRFGGEQTDGMNPARHEQEQQQQQQQQSSRQHQKREHVGIVNVAQVDGGGGEDCVDAVRNKRSVSVDSGLQQRNGMRYEDARGPVGGLQPMTIYEEMQHDLAAEEGSDDSVDRMVAKKGARKVGRKVTTTTAAVKPISRLRGRADIHN